MTTRTFKQLGVAFGSETATIDVTVGGTNVYSGPVTTRNEPWPSLPSPGIDLSAELFTFTQDSAFEGGVSLSISVSGSDVLLSDSVANYIGVVAVDPSPSPAKTEAPTIVSGGADVFGAFNATVIDGISYNMPLINVELDGVPQDQTPNPSMSGQTYWTIPAGSTLTATINIQAGVV